MNARILPVALFTLAYLGAAMALAVRHWNYEFIFYGAVMFLIIGGVVLLDRRVRFTAWVLWGLSAWGLLHLLGGTVPVPARFLEPNSLNTLYNLRLHPDAPKYDQVVHAFGFFVSTLASWQAMAAFTRGSGGSLRPTIGPLICAVLAGMGLGAVNEVIEFVATRVMPGTNVGGYVNTGWDLVSNLTGCVLAAAVIRLRARARHKQHRPAPADMLRILDDGTTRPATPMPGAGAAPASGSPGRR